MRERGVNNSCGPRTGLAVPPIIRPQSTDDTSDHGSVKCWRVSPCTSDTCRPQRCHLRADDHPIWAEDARTDREQPQNILHRDFIVRLQEDRYRV